MAEYRAPESGIDEKRELSQEDTAIGTAHHLAHHAHQAINASGHRDQLDRNYGILSICGLALTVDNAWVAIGTSLNVAICEFRRAPRRELRALTFLADNGGPPGVLYEFLVASLYYCFIAASLAEVSFTS
jgi:hypothetical protein